MHVLLIRHAQSTNNPLEGSPDFAGSRLPDPSLTPLGREQAAQFAAWAAHDDLGRRITHLYSSLMTRAVQTAAPLAQTLGLSVHGLADAHECGGLTTGPAGNFTPVMGRDHASLLTDCPALIWPQHLPGQPWDGGGEPWDAAHFARRAARVAAHLQAGSDGADVMALITHHDFAPHVIAALLGQPIPAGEGASFHLRNMASALIELGARTGRPVLHWIDRTPHLTWPS